LSNPVASVNIWTIVMKGAKVIGSGAASVGSEQFEHLIELAGRGELHPLVDRELPLEQAPEAHRLIEQRKVFGKIVLRTD
jgi:NADPH:quinone reductase-like Zn-dependent oxidoreductase